MKKVLAILMCLSMVLCFMPTIAFAEGDEIVTTDVAGAQNEVQNGNDAVAGSEDGEGTGEAQNPDQGGTGNEDPAPKNNVAKVVKANATATEYSTLAEAVAAAEADDVIEVLKDFEMTESILISKKVTINLNSKTITVAIPDNGTTKSAFVVNGNQGDLTVKNGKIQGEKPLLPNSINGSGKITNVNDYKDNRAIEGHGDCAITIENVVLSDFTAKTSNGGVLYVDKGNLTVKDSSLGYYEKGAERAYGGNYALNGGAIYAKDSTLTISGTRLFYNTSLDPNAKQGSPYSGGGAILAENGSLDISAGCYFFYNQTWDHGGAIHLDQVDIVRIDNSRFIRCSALVHDGIGGQGGAIYSRISKNVVISNSTIDGNSASWGSGGGANILGNKDSSVTLTNNTISNNSAGKRGGGLCLHMAKGSVLNPITGWIISNDANGFGGGIDYTGHGMEPLRLQNVLITENVAARGAGIWACPTSETQTYSTLGGAIYGNTASGETSGTTADNKYPASGDEVRYEGIDAPDKFVVPDEVDMNDEDASTGNEASSTTIMTVVKRALGGGVMKWYQDEAENRYQDQTNAAEANPDLYTNTNKSFGLHGELSTEHQKLAQTEAQLVIKDNYVIGGRGGGIATNSPVEIGLKDADVSVEVKKEWSTETHPEEIKVDLYRIDADKTEVKLDSDVVLNAENNWSAAFTDLPSKYIDKNGAEQNYTYTVKEQPTSGWTCSTSSEYDEATRTYKITLKNTPSGGGYIPTPTPTTKYPLTISKVVAGLDVIPADYAVTVTITSKTGAVQTLTLKANEQKTIELPQGEYVISEAAPSVDGYTLTGQNISENNFVLTTGGKSIVITNTYEKDADEPAVDPTPTKPEQPTKPEDKTEVPKTGDNSALAGSALLLLLSACGLAAALRRKED